LICYRSGITFVFGDLIWEGGSPPLAAKTRRRKAFGNTEGKLPEGKLAALRRFSGHESPHATVLKPWLGAWFRRARPIRPAQAKIRSAGRHAASRPRGNL